MAAVQADFDQRCQETEAYIDFLSKLEKTSDTDAALMATMKASALLMIYNLVESTMTNLIESIFDHLRGSKIGFLQVDDVLKAFVLGCARDHNPKALVKKMRDESIDLAVASFKRDSIFSGNVDCRKIRDVLTECGVALSGKYSESVLLQIKSARNDLAHGAKSFSDLGKHESADELDRKYKAVRAVLLKALKDVAQHIDQKLKLAVAA